MRILFTLTYYAPHISGLSCAVRHRAEALAARGHEVTVLASRHSSDLPREENIGGVSVFRVPARFRISKGVLMFSYWRHALRLIPRADAVIVALPATPIETLLVPLVARVVARKPVVIDYHCDVRLRRGPFNRVGEKVVQWCNLAAVRMADRVIASTLDYARHSPVLRLSLDKFEEVPLPILTRTPSPSAVSAIRRQFSPSGEVLIGFAGRLATEKGLPVLLEALELVRRKIPHARVLQAGDITGVVGEERFRDEILARLQAIPQEWVCLGFLQPDLIDFLAALDGLVLPSVNSTESFGMVQVESMLCGTPVVASDLPGVRVPVQATGMGKLAPPGDPRVLAEAILEVLEHRERFLLPREKVVRRLLLGSSVEQLETLLKGVTRLDYLRQYLQEGPIFAALVRGVECRLLERELPLPEPVLDLGCGDGLFTSIARAGKTFVGLDLKKNELRRAGLRNSYRNLVVASATAMPLRDGSFQTVLANSALEHIPAVEEALAECFRVLRKGGMLLVTAPSHKFAGMLWGSGVLRRFGLGRLSRSYGDWFNRRARHAHTDDISTWRNRLADIGFEIDDDRYYLSEKALHAFDIAHYLSVVRLFWYRCTGDWVPFPNLLTNRLWEHWLRPFYDNYDSDGEGPLVFLKAKKP